jgi:hypothetical protein
MFCESESILNFIETKEEYMIKVTVSYYFETHRFGDWGTLKKSTPCPHHHPSRSPTARYAARLISQVGISSYCCLSTSTARQHAEVPVSVEQELQGVSVTPPAMRSSSGLPFSRILLDSSS